MKTNEYATQIDFARRGARVLRYHTHAPLRPDTVGQHSHGVAMLCMVLRRGKPGERLLMAALTHDLAEHILGDIPSPAKRLMDRQKLNAMEKDLLNAADFDIPLSDFDAWVLKLADILDGMLFCTEDRMLGSRALDEVFNTYISYWSRHMKATPMVRAHGDFYAEVTGVSNDIVTDINERKSKYER